MAMLGCCAPVPETVITMLPNVLALIEKIRGDIPDVYSSCLQSEFPKLNSSENSLKNEDDTLKNVIGIQAAPELKALSESKTLDANLRLISQGLKMHHALWTNISKHLETKCQDPPMLYDIRDLDALISEIAGGEAAEETKLTLNMLGKYYTKKAAQQTLLQLEKFLQNVEQFLMSLVQSGGPTINSG